MESHASTLPSLGAKPSPTSVGDARAALNALIADPVWDVEGGEALRARVESLLADDAPKAPPCVAPPKARTRKAGAPDSLPREIHARSLPRGRAKAATGA